MKLKDETVNIWGLELPMRIVLAHADRIWRDLGQELVVTCARDGMHGAGSYHYFGYAVDLRTRYFDDGGREALRRLRAALPRGYDVVQEDTHIHVEYEIDKIKQA